MPFLRENIFINYVYKVKVFMTSNACNFLIMMKRQNSNQYPTVVIDHSQISNLRNSQSTKSNVPIPVLGNTTPIEYLFAYL